MLFAKDILRPRLRQDCERCRDGWVKSHRARERTPADRDRCGWHKIVIRDRCGWHKIVIVAAGTMRPISIATPFWTLGTVSEIATGIDQIEDYADYFDTLANHVHLTLQNHQPHRDDLGFVQS